MIISPYSVSSALFLLSQAAGGNSLEEIKTALHLSGEKSAIADEYFNHYGLLHGNAGNATLSIANKVYVQQGSNLNKNFQEVVTSKLFSGVDSVDFGKLSEAAQTINHFVEEKTHDKIKNLFTPDALEGASAVLVNAIYLKANWEEEFKEYKTYKQDFYTSETEKSTAEFMHDTESFNYGVLSDLDASALELKYVDSHLAMLFVLPNSKTGLSALETKLNDYDLSKVSPQIERHLVKVAIPKFKVEHTVDLKQILPKV